MAILLALLACLSGPALGDAAARPGSSITAATFARLCGSADWEVACRSYATGVLHGSQRGTATICLRYSEDTERLYDLGLDYIRRHLERAEDPAFLLLLEAWEQVFPCPGS